VSPSSKLSGNAEKWRPYIGFEKEKLGKEASQRQGKWEKGSDV
jgi:hypothetical protein